MFLRLILAVVLAAFAVPGAAVPACHDAAPMAAMHHGAPATPEDKARPTHACIGCIPPGDWTRARIAAPIPQLRVAVASRVEPLDLRPHLPPATPPPRAG